MKTNKKITSLVIMASFMLAFASCGTKKAVSEGGSSVSSATKSGSGQGATGNSRADAQAASLQQMNYLRKVTDNAAYSKNVVSKIKLTINTGSNDITVAGSLRMRNDEVIRIQITPLGIMEAGLLEFTPDYVLLVDRIHKEYVKASYAEVDFLQQNGLDFYTLQALFWNKLFLPGTQKVTDSSLKNFTVDLKGAATTDISLTKGKMKYVWSTNSKTALINSVTAKYSDSKNGSTSVSCEYSSFGRLGTKSFPTDINLRMSTKAIRNADKMSLRLNLNTLSTDSDWDAKTTVSSKYKKVEAAEILGKLGSL